MYFKLNPECYLVMGRSRGAIFDLIKEEIYPLEAKEARFIASCEKNLPVCGDEDLLKRLKRLCLGNFYLNKSYVQKLRVGTPLADEQEIGNPPELYRAFLEINNLCNRDCWFCGYQGVKRSMGCMGCNKWRCHGKPLPVDRWMELIDELKYLKCRDLYISGGDLTLVWDKTMDILNYAKGKFINIYVKLHEQSLSENVMNDLKGKAKAIIQTDNPYCTQYGDSIFLLTIKPDNWKKFSNFIGKNLLVDFVVDKVNALPSESPLISEGKMSANMYTFLNNIKYHPCLGHALVVCYDGNVIPCPMMRDHCLGNVANDGLYSIFRDEEVEKFWRLTLDKIDKCKGCEFRYACTDCRSLEEGLTGKLNGKQSCDYDPMEGKWL